MQLCLKSTGIDTNNLSQIADDNLLKLRNDLYSNLLKQNKQRENCWFIRFIKTSNPMALERTTNTTITNSSIKRRLGIRWRFIQMIFTSMN